MLISKKRLLSLLPPLTFAFLLLFYHAQHANLILQPWILSSQSRLVRAPANNTLGFGAIVVVSRQASKRRHSLVQAANVTDLDLTIPSQPNWTESDVRQFVNGQDGVQRGSVLAWLGHSNALRWFLRSGLETALILEDDVDWDIRLRSLQIPLAANAVRQVLPAAQSSHPLSILFGHSASYWGDLRAWDLLYLGHCGDYFGELTSEGLRHDDHLFNLSAIHHVLYQDPTLPSVLNLHPFTQQLFSRLDIPARSRVLHRSQFPLCSFGYAVTRAAAQRLLDDLAPPRYAENGPRAYDVALLNACEKDASLVSSSSRSSSKSGLPWSRSAVSSSHKHSDLGLRCWTLNSELFHHMPGHSQIAEESQKLGEQPGIPPVDLAAQAQVADRNETSNIECGFWSGAFAFNDTDTERLCYLKEQVGRQGKCLKDGRDPTGHHVQS